MEGKCHEVFAEVAKLHTNAHVLAQVWNAWDIDADRRQKSIDNLRERAVALKEKAAVRPRDVNDFFNFLDTLERYNKGEGTIHDLVGKMDNLTEELAIHAIADCECIRPIKPPPRMNVVLMPSTGGIEEAE